MAAMARKTQPGSAGNSALYFYTRADYRTAEPLMQPRPRHRRGRPRAGPPQCGHQPQQSGRAACAPRTASPRPSRSMRRALAIDKAASGRTTPNVAVNLNNLAALFRTPTASPRPSRSMRRALAIDEAALGPDHPDVATSLNNLAGCFRTRNRPGEAEPLYRRALDIHEKAFGPDHPNVGTSLNNLAALLQDTQPPRRGRAALSPRPRHRRGRPRAGPPRGGQPQQSGRCSGHERLARPSRFMNAPSLSRGLPEPPQCAQPQQSGRAAAARTAAEAEPLYERAMAIFETSLGPDHPHTKTVKANYERFKAKRGDKEG